MLATSLFKPRHAGLFTRRLIFPLTVGIIITAELDEETETQIVGEIDRESYSLQTEFSPNDREVLGQNRPFLDVISLRHCLAVDAVYDLLDGTDDLVIHIDPNITNGRELHASVKPQPFEGRQRQTVRRLQRKVFQFRLHIKV